MSADILVFSPPAAPGWGGYLMRHGVAEVSGHLKSEGYAVDQRSLFVECRYRNRHRLNDDVIDLTPFRVENTLKHLHGNINKDIRQETQTMGRLLDISSYDTIIAPMRGEHIIPQNDFRLLLALAILKDETREDQTTIIGGPNPEKMAVSRFPFVDYAIQGDQELPLKHILAHEYEGAELQVEPGISYETEDGDLNRGHPYQHPMNDKPKPYFDPEIVAMDAKTNALNRRIIPYNLGRGCTQNCSFCMYYENQEFQYKSVDKVVQELSEITDATGADHVFFTDENLFNDPDYMVELSRRFQDDGLDISWAGQTIIVPREQEFFDTLAAGGCKTLQHGIESASNSVLHRMNKHQTRTMIENTLKKEHNAGIKTIALLLTDYVDETPDEYYETIDFIKQNPHLSGYRVASLQVVPDERQPLYRDPERFGIEVDPENWGGDDLEKMLQMFSVPYRTEQDTTAEDKHKRQELKERHLSRTAGIELHLKNFAVRHPLAFMRLQLHKLRTEGSTDISHYYV